MYFIPSYSPTWYPSLTFVEFLGMTSRASGLCFFPVATGADVPSAPPPEAEVGGRFLLPSEGGGGIDPAADAADPTPRPPATAAAPLEIPSASGPLSSTPPSPPMLEPPTVTPAVLTPMAPSATLRALDLASFLLRFFSHSAVTRAKTD